MQCRLLALCLFGILSNSSFADSSLNLAKTVQNPLRVNPESRYYSYTLENYSNFGTGTTHTTQDVLEFNPLVPLHFTANYDVIIKTVIPFVRQASGTGNGFLYGLGDINPAFYVTPAVNSTVLWGVGPILYLPTATNTALGMGKVSIGPALAFIAMPGRWSLSISTYNYWSVAGKSGFPNTNFFNFQYYITYNFHKGWYITTQPDVTADWTATSSERWTVPIGAGVGRTFKLSGQPVNFSLQAYANVVHPSVGPQWSLQLAFDLLMPDKRFVS